MNTLLWLDDYRDPSVNNWLSYSPIDKPYEVIWVKSYNEFTNWITKNGLPTAICFDHDLADFSGPNGDERTGKDCANWLVEYCLDNNLRLPLYNMQSSNTSGRENIDSLFKSYIKHFNNK